MTVIAKCVGNPITEMNTHIRVYVRTEAIFCSNNTKYLIHIIEYMFHTYVIKSPRPSDLGSIIIPY